MKRFISSERGTEMAEVGIVLALVVVVAIGAFSGLGQSIVAVVQSVAGAI